jgi:RNA polymerase sigma factor (TIGR02999 family)
VVHEAWLRIAAKAGDSLDTEAAFRQWAGRIVRQVLVDHARKRHAIKRDVRRKSSLIDAASEGGMTPEELLSLSDLLDQMAIAQPRMASVVEMKYFGGMRDTDIALRLGVSDRTVRQDWAVARAWLYGRLREDT